MSSHDVAAVLRIEQRVYEFPWTHGNFIDSLAAGYLAELLQDAEGGVLAYFVALPGVDELHLLNLSVAPEQQRQGHARTLLDRLEALCRARGLPRLWLEVRESNLRAIGLYTLRGFAAVGQRRNYYPAAGGREHAVLMRLDVLSPRSNDALD